MKSEVRFTVSDVGGWSPTNSAWLDAPNRWQEWMWIFCDTLLQECVIKVEMQTSQNVKVSFTFTSVVRNAQQQLLCATTVVAVVLKLNVDLGESWSELGVKLPSPDNSNRALGRPIETDATT